MSRKAEVGLFNSLDQLKSGIETLKLKDGSVYNGQTENGIKDGKLFGSCIGTSLLMFLFCEIIV